MTDESEPVPAIDRSGGISDEVLNEALDAQEAKAQDAPDSTPTESASAPAEAKVSTTEVVPPEHWSAEDQEAFLKADESTRDVLKRFDVNFTKGIEEKSLALKPWEDLAKTYQPLLGVGADPVQAAEQLFKAQAFLSQNPVDGIKWLMKSYGVEKSFEPSQEPTGAEDLDFSDPEVKRLRQELQDTKDEQSQRERQATQRQQQQQLAMIQQFKTAEEDGKLTYPHFDELLPLMSGLLTSGRATDLDDAYGQAFKAHPEYIEKEVERIIAERAETAAKARVAETEKAEAASKGPQGSQDAKSVKGKGNWEQDLEENFEKSERGEL